MRRPSRGDVARAAAARKKAMNYQSPLKWDRRKSGQKGYYDPPKVPKGTEEPRIYRHIPSHVSKVYYPSGSRPSTSGHRDGSEGRGKATGSGSKDTPEAREDKGKKTEESKKSDKKSKKGDKKGTGEKKKKEEGPGPDGSEGRT